MKPKKEKAVPLGAPAIAAAHPAAGAAAHATPGGEPIRVVVVDDDEWIRATLVDSINAAKDMRCIGACASAEEALAMVPAVSPDVVLMDIGLPKMNGVDCVRQIKLKLPHLSVLMLTVYGDSERVFSALLAGANGYLLKRAVSVDLLASIRQVYQGESPMNGYIARQVVQHFNNKGAVAAEMENLSRRERELLTGLAKGQAYKQIAEELGISIDTLRDYVKSVYRKLHVHSRGEAVAKFTKTLEPNSETES
ncbi:MAG: response regulator transcription factor [Verrucomicrobiota bacterium]